VKFGEAGVGKSMDRFDLSYDQLDAFIASWKDITTFEDAVLWLNSAQGEVIRLERINRDLLDEIHSMDSMLVEAPTGKRFWQRLLPKRNTGLKTELKALRKQQAKIPIYIDHLRMCAEETPTDDQMRQQQIRMLERKLQGLRIQKEEGSEKSKIEIEILNAEYTVERLKKFS
jgi:hypothetical protein